jgi:hypothetical protein
LSRVPTLHSYLALLAGFGELCIMPPFVGVRRQNKAPKNSSKKLANKVANKITKKSAKKNAAKEKWRSPAEVAKKKTGKKAVGKKKAKKSKR